MTVLEIGCGAGRITRALAGFFGEVYAVDISRHMVVQARRAVASFPNAHIFRNNGSDLSAVRRLWWHRFGIGRELRFDFAFSCLVFQHISSRAVIESYLRETNRRSNRAHCSSCKCRVALRYSRTQATVGSGWRFRKDAQQWPNCDFELRHQSALATSITGCGFLKQAIPGSSLRDAWWRLASRPCSLRRLAQYFFIRSETSMRS